MANLEFDNSLPIYQQLMDLWRRSIVCGNWALGERVPSVRDLASQYGVNPNTVQRALTELEREGLMYSNRTAGRFITDEEDLLRKIKEKLAGELVQRFVAEAGALQLDKTQLLERLDAALNEEEENL